MLPDNVIRMNQNIFGTLSVIAGAGVVFEEVFSVPMGSGDDLPSWEKA